MDHTGSGISRWLRLLVRRFIWKAFSCVKSVVFILNKAVFSLVYSLITGLTLAFSWLDVTDR